MYACARGVEAQLADWNAHAVDAEITKTENAAAICYNCDLDIVRPVLNDLVEVAAVFVGEVEAWWWISRTLRFSAMWSTTNLLAVYTAPTIADMLLQPLGYR